MCFFRNYPTSSFRAEEGYCSYKKCRLWSKGTKEKSFQCIPIFISVSLLRSFHWLYSGSPTEESTESLPASQNQLRTASVMGLQGPPNGCGIFRKDNLSSGHSYPSFPTFSPEFLNSEVVIRQFPSPIPPSIGGTLRIQLPGSKLWTKKHFLWVPPFGQQCNSPLHLQQIPSVSHKLVTPLLFPHHEV